MIFSYADELCKVKAEIKELQNMKHYKFFNKTNSKYNKVIYWLYDKKIEVLKDITANKDDKQKIKDNSFYYRTCKNIEKAMQEYQNRVLFLNKKQLFIEKLYIKEMGKQVLEFIKDNPKLQNVPLHYKKFKNAIEKQFPDFYITCDCGFIMLNSRKNHNVEAYLSKYISPMQRYYFTPEMLTEEYYNALFADIPYNIDIDEVINNALEAVKEMNNMYESIEREISNMKYANYFNLLDFNDKEHILYIPYRIQ